MWSLFAKDLNHFTRYWSGQYLLSGAVSAVLQWPPEENFVLEVVPGSLQISRVCTPACSFLHCGSPHQFKESDSASHACFEPLDYA